MEEVFQLLAQEAPPDHIIIETSGVSDPTLVAHTFQLTAMNAIVEVDSIITVVDADQALNLDQSFKELAKRQIQIGDLILINKTDLVSPQQLQKVHAYAKQLAPKARIIESVNCQVPLSLLIGNGSFQLDEVLKDTSTHKMDFQTWTYKSNEPFTFIAIRKILEGLPNEIYRSKGFIQLEDAPLEQGLFQMTGGRAWLRLGHPWQNPIRTTRLVFIGKANEIDSEKVNEHIDACQKKYSRKALDENEEPVLIEDLRALTVMFD